MYVLTVTDYVEEGRYVPGERTTAFKGQLLSALRPRDGRAVLLGVVRRDQS